MLLTKDEFAEVFDVSLGLRVTRQAHTFHLDYRYSINYLSYADKF